MENEGWGKIIGLIFGGGAFGAILTYMLGSRKQNQSEFVVLLENYKGMVDDLKEEMKSRIDGYDEKLTEHTNQINELKQILLNRDQEIIQLRNQLMIFESSHTDVPVPIWLKDTSGKMLFLNKVYAEKLLHPLGKSAEDYIGNYDKDIWGREVAANFGRHDKKVMHTKKPEEMVESWPGPDGVMWEGRVIKYPRFAGRDTIIGIGGIIVDMWIKDEDCK